MANELRIPHTTAKTVYALLLNATGQAWNGAAFEALTSANWATYAIALTEVAGTGIYLGNMPAVAAGVYSVTLYERQGGAPATSDYVIGLGAVQWDGAAVVLPGSAAALAAVDDLVDDLESRLTAGRAAALDNLDATVSSRLAAAAYTAPDDTAVLAALDALPTAAEIDAQLSDSHGAGQWESGAAVDPDFCRVSDTEKTGLGKPVAGRTITVELVDPDPDADAAIYETEPHETVSGSDGYWYFDLIRGKTYRVVIAEAGIDQNVLVPADAAATLRSLL
ncbi:MAG: hypothetical protein ACK47B_10970 [Armatimonadota bacterium]